MMCSSTVSVRTMPAAFNGREAHHCIAKLPHCLLALVCSHRQTTSPDLIYNLSVSDLSVSSPALVWAAQHISRFTGPGDSRDSGADPGYSHHGSLTGSLSCTVLYCTILNCTVMYCTWSVPWYWQWACLPVLPHPLPPLLATRPPPEYWWV